MKHDLHDYIKIFLENKKVTIVLLIALFPALGGHLYGLLDVPAKPVKVAEKAPNTVIEDIVKPKPVMTEIVTVVNKPHTHPLEEHSHPECKRLLAEHEASSLH